MEHPIQANHSRMTAPIDKIEVSEVSEVNEANEVNEASEVNVASVEIVVIEWDEVVLNEAGPGGTRAGVVPAVRAVPMVRVEGSA